MDDVRTPRDRRNDLCQAYFNKMKPDDHKCNKLLSAARFVPYAVNHVVHYTVKAFDCVHHART